MSLLSEAALQKTAEEIEPFISPIIRKKGHIDGNDIRKLCRLHATHKIVTDRSCEIVSDYLIGERIPK